MARNLRSPDRLRLPRGISRRQQRMEDNTTPSNQLWAVVLAAGRGTRLGSVTRALCGRELPKQFVALTTERTLLQETIERIASLAPPERTVVVVSEQYAEIARAQLALHEGIEIVVQPEDRGTAAGVMLGLAHVRARAPEAEVAIFPSDHHIDRPEALVNAVRRGRQVAGRVPSGIALLGVPAERAASDLGWIVPGQRRIPGGTDVQAFVEKPAPDRAMELLASGALWNTMVMVTSVAALWRLFRRHLPAQTRAFERYVRVIQRSRSYRLLSLLYDRMRPADFSRDLMEVTAGLAVVPMVDAGWFDCGTPERLVAWLTSASDPSGILSRLRQSPSAATGSWTIGAPVVAVA
jgi:mannose-1-phosphate guanylyltransferase